MAQQVYASSIGVVSTTTASIATTPAIEHGGGTLSWGTALGLNGNGVQHFINTTGIGTAELNYDNRIATQTSAASTTSDGADLYAELQNIVALMCRSTTGVATTGGLNGVSYNNAGTVATGVVVTQSPRTIWFRIQQMANAALSQPNV